MALEGPSTRQLADIAASYGMTLEGAELDQLSALAQTSVKAYGRLDELDVPPRPVGYPRADLGRRPLGDDNPGNGWSWRCSIPGAPDGPLAGVRVAVKDHICVAGIPMLNGSAMLEGYVPREDATIVTRLLDAGAEIVGKTAVPAFCMDGGSVTGYPRPEPTNPHDPERLPGASSSGSAVVVAHGEAEMAIGGDQGGSIRIPASWSGIVGHKPTYGLVPYTGAFPIELTLDHLGPMCRTVADCARMLEVIAGDDGLDPRCVQWAGDHDYTRHLDRGIEGMRVGVVTEGFGWDGVSQDAVDETVREATRTFADLGATVEEVSVPMHRDGLAIWNAIATEGAADLMVRGNAMGSNWRGHYLTDLLDFYARARVARADEYPPTVKLQLLVGHYMSERYGRHYYAKAQNLSHALRASYDSALDAYDVLLMPTTAMTARRRPAPDVSLPELMTAAFGAIHNTAQHNVTGHPALSVPCGMVDGLPVGLQIVGRHFADATVLRAGHAFEQARDDLRPASTSATPAGVS